MSNSAERERLIREKEIHPASPRIRRIEHETGRRVGGIRDISNILASIDMSQFTPERLRRIELATLRRLIPK